MSQIIQIRNLFGLKYLDHEVRIDYLFEVRKLDYAWYILTRYVHVSSMEGGSYCSKNRA